MAKYKKSSGNVLFLVLIIAGLFGALAYSVTTSTSTSPTKIEDETQKLDKAVLNNCESAINLALLRLRNFGNCSDDEINYELPDGTNANPIAPSDGHCNIFHPAYGGASPCGLTEDPGCDLTTLSIGESCGGIVYAGESGGNRLYTHRADHGNTTWNNGSTSWVVTGSGSTSDGLSNTNLLVSLSDGGAPYQAAQLCRSLGEKWYLPSYDELGVLYTNHTVITGFDESGIQYWTSSEFTDCGAWKQKFSDGSYVHAYYSKDEPFQIRCIRRD